MKEISEKQIWFLESQGIDTTNLTARQAFEAIKAIKEGTKFVPTKSQGVPTGNTGNFSNKRILSQMSSPDTNVQKSIVRQCCLKCAIEFLGTTPSTKEDVIKTAEEFEKWVNRE